MNRNFLLTTLLVLTGIAFAAKPERLEIARSILNHPESAELATKNFSTLLKADVEAEINGEAAELGMSTKQYLEAEVSMKAFVDQMKEQTNNLETATPEELLILSLKGSLRRTLHIIVRPPTEDQLRLESAVNQILLKIQILLEKQARSRR